MRRTAGSLLPPPQLTQIRLRPALAVAHARSCGGGGRLGRHDPGHGTKYGVHAVQTTPPGNRRCKVRKGPPSRRVLARRTSYSVPSTQPGVLAWHWRRHRASLLPCCLLACQPASQSPTGGARGRPPAAGLDRRRRANEWTEGEETGEPERAPGENLEETGKAGRQAGNRASTCARACCSRPAQPAIARGRPSGASSIGPAARH